MPHEPANILAQWSAHLAQASGLPVVLGSSPPPEALRSARAQRDSVDLHLWLEACRSAPSAEILPTGGQGPLVAWDQRVAIEVWTEEELSGMHALVRLARRMDSAAAWARLRSAVRWHIEHTQPDNGTNRPWAVHAFLLEGSPEAHAYAGTLLHNALALSGRPTSLSAWILMDAAAELQLAAGLARAG
jgi:hypothetical protein